LQALHAAKHHGQADKQPAVGRRAQPQPT
jgi:hypothetical protein